MLTIRHSESGKKGIDTNSLLAQNENRYSIMVRPFKRGALRNRLTAHLFDAILHGELSAGERIVEGKLAQQLGVAQSTVREALQQLEHQGLLRTVGLKPGAPDHSTRGDAIGGEL